MKFEETTSAPLSKHLRALFGLRSFAIGTVLVVFLVLVAFFAPVLTSVDPIAQDLPLRLSAPGGLHFFGTDEYGRDLYSRAIYGSRISLMVGVVAVLIGATLGTIMGLIAGFFGGWVDRILSRFIDVLLAFPQLLMALTVIAILGPSLMNAMVAVGISTSPRFARLIRGTVLSIKARDYVEAARATGASSTRMLVRHVLPNTISTLIVMASLRTGAAILTESNLSFLGLGVQPPTPSWGGIISTGREFIQEAPWLSFIPGIVILLAVMGFNLMGEGLRDFLDPRLRQR
jgi:peptide/nickel transport system permease protein